MTTEPLAKVVESMGFSDCTFVATYGQEFAAHRVIVGRYPKLKALVAKRQRVTLPESAEVVEGMLSFIYGAKCDILQSRDPETDGEGWLTRLLVLRGAAVKYDISDSKGDLAFFLTDQIGRLTAKALSVKTAVLQLRELLDCKEDSVAIQKVIVTRLLDLIAEGEVSGVNGKRKRLLGDFLSSLETQVDGKMVYPDVIVVPKKTETVRAGSPKKSEPKAKRSTTGKDEKTQLHCVCREPEDPYLVECENCKNWFHPNCLGKGRYVNSTATNGRLNARQGDERNYRTKNLTFHCLNCESAVAK